MATRSSRPARRGDLRAMLDAAMEIERQAMELYCKFEHQFRRDPTLRAFWFDMAQHEARHFGGLALVAGLLASAPRPKLSLALTPARVAHLRGLLANLHREAARGVDIERAFEMAIEVEGSEIEDVVLDLLRALKGDRERERAVHLLLHDLGDLGYMIEKYTANDRLLARADELLEHHVRRLPRRASPEPRPARISRVRR